MDQEALMAEMDRLARAIALVLPQMIVTPTLNVPLIFFWSGGEDLWRAGEIWICPDSDRPAGYSYRVLHNQPIPAPYGGRQVLFCWRHNPDTRQDETLTDCPGLYFAELDEVLYYLGRLLRATNNSGEINYFLRPAAD